MSAFVISFEIGDRGDAAARRSSLIDKIAIEAMGSTWASDHLIVMNSDKTTADLAFFLFHGTSLDRYQDQLLVFNLERGDFAAHGRVTDRSALRALLVQEEGGRYAVA